MKVRMWLCWGILTQILTLMFSAMIYGQAGEWVTFNTSNSGLASDDVREIAVDGDYLWFGTSDKGLSRYQKSVDSWVTFTVDSGLISNNIRSLAVDGGNIWIGTDKGISRYQKSQNSWQNFTTSNTVQAIGVDWEYVWFGTNGSGVRRYRKSNQEWKEFSTSNSWLVSDKVISIGIDGSTIWFGTDAGACYLDRLAEQWSPITVPYTGTFTHEIFSIGVDGDHVWFGNESGAHRYHKPTGDWKTFFTKDTVRTGNQINITYRQVIDIKVGGDYVWWVPWKKGVQRYRKTTEDVVNFGINNSGITQNQVYSIELDGSYVWFATYKGGVTRYQNPISLWAKFQKTNSGLVDDIIRAIATDGEYVWLGTYKKGISRYQIFTGSWKTYTMQNSDLVFDYILSIAADSDYVWFGVLGGWLCRYEKLTNSWTNFKSSDLGLGDNSIYSIAVDGDSLWLGTGSGQISLYQKSTGTWSSLDSSRTGFSDWIYSIDVDNDYVWFAMYGGGVGYYQQSTDSWAVFNTSNSELTHNTVSSVGVDGDSVWFGTFGGVSLYQKSSNSWKTFTSSNSGLIENYVTSLAVNGDYIWIGTLRQGVCRFQKTTGIWKTYDKNNSELVTNNIRVIEVGEGYVWFSTYDTNKENGGVSRYGDVNPPHLVHTPIVVEQPSNTSILILATINDEVAVTGANVNYRLMGTMQYNSVPLEYRSGTTWIGYISAKDVIPGTMEYYLAATDGRNIATHPYASAANSPHRFRVYDSVPPVISASVTSANGFLADSININVGISIDGTGSIPSLNRITLIQYEDYSTEQIVDTVDISLAISWEEKNENQYLISGTTNLGVLTEGVVCIKLGVTAGDDGHDEKGNPLIAYALSNPLFRFKGWINVNAEEGNMLRDATGMASLYIPPNALPMDLHVQFAATRDPLEQGVNTIGPAYEINPPDINLRKPATLTIFLKEQDWQKISNPKNISMFGLQKVGRDSIWNKERIGGWVDAGKLNIVAVIKKFSAYGVIEEEAIGGELTISQVNSQPRIFSCMDGGHTTISFCLGKKSNVTVMVYNLSGRLVRILRENMSMGKGMIPIEWDGKDGYGKFCVSGLYLVMIQAEGKKATKTVMVLNN